MKSAREAEVTGVCHQIVIAGAGYAGLHVALRLAESVSQRHDVEVVLIDRHDYHQALTELPRVAGGTQSGSTVRIPLDRMLARSVRFIETTITGFDFPRHTLLTEAGPVSYTRLVLALGSRPNDFAIPGLTEHALLCYSVDDAERVWTAVNAAVDAASGELDPEECRRLVTVVIGGGGATGVELAGELAEELPILAHSRGLADSARVMLVEAGLTILAGSSPDLISRADKLLAELGVIVRVDSQIVAVTDGGLTLKDGETIASGVFVWAGGVKAPELVVGAGLPSGHNDRVRVDDYLRALGHPEVYVAGDLASVVNPETGRVLPPLAQIAIDEGESVARNLRAELDGKPLEPFNFRTKGLVVSVGGQRGVADLAGHAFNGRLVHLLKEAIEWEYRQSVKHLHGWSLT